MSIPSDYFRKQSTQNEWSYWLYEQLTGTGGNFKATALCVTIGTPLAVVGIAVAGIAALIFSCMSLGPIGLLLAGAVTTGVAALVPQTMLALLGAFGQGIFSNAFAGGAGWRAGGAGWRYVYEHEMKKEGMTSLYKEEFNTVMRAPLKEFLKEFLPKIEQEDANREELVKEVCTRLDALLKDAFPNFSDLEEEKKKELQFRIDIEKSLCIQKIFEKLGDPGYKAEEPGEETSD